MGVWLCGLLVDTEWLVWRGIGMGRGGFLFDIGMVEPNCQSAIVTAYTRIDGSDRPGLWCRDKLVQKEASDCTVTVDSRM